MMPHTIKLHFIQLEPESGQRTSLWHCNGNLWYCLTQVPLGSGTLGEMTLHMLVLPASPPRCATSTQLGYTQLIHTQLGTSQLASIHSEKRHEVGSPDHMRAVCS